MYTYKQNALSRQKVQPMHHSSIAGVEDMATLEDLHEGAIMHNLFLRYQQRHIYVSFPAAVPTRSVGNVENAAELVKHFDPTFMRRVTRFLRWPPSVTR